MEISKKIERKNNYFNPILRGHFSVHEKIT